MGTEPDVMAEIKWAFIGYTPTGQAAFIHGSDVVRSYKTAKKVVDEMNLMFGEHTHWCTPLNYTWEERHEYSCDD